MQEDGNMNHDRFEPNVLLTTTEAETPSQVSILRRVPMKMRLLLYALAVPLLCALSPLARADYIACPAETTWNVTTPLPDPWSATMQKTSRSEQMTVLINSVEWLVCRYSHTDGQTSVYSQKNDVFSLHLQRPVFSGVGINKEICPGNTIATGVTSPVPAPWKSTKYIWTLDAAYGEELAGQSLIVCRYIAHWDSQRVGPSSLLRPLNLGDDKPLAPTPKPEPQLPGNIAAEFAVTNVSLATVPAPRQRACPAKVGFQGSIQVNGPGDVIYRIVDNKGVAGPQQKLTFTKAGEKPLAFQINVSAPVSPPPAQGGSFTTAPAPSGPQVTAAGGGGPAATNNVAGASTPGALWGFQRVEILAPASGKTKSQDAAWSVQCVTVNKRAGATSIQTQPEKPSATLSAPKTPPPSKTRESSTPKETEKK
jgi:hypothetical protein